MKNQIEMLIELQEMDSQNEKGLPKAEKSKGKNRDKVRTAVNPQIFNLYEKLFNAKDGHALAKIEDGICGGCNVVLPTKEIPFIAEAKNIVQCWNCQRILYT